MEMNKTMDDSLNECLERVVFRGESMEAVLKSYPEQAAELEPLLKTALLVKKAASISPRAEFRARARYEFHQALAQEKSKKRGLFTNLMPRWTTALSAALAVLLISGGTVAAASSSMPDSFLYPVKLAAEQARMTLTLSQESKAELYADLTDKRVDEIVYIANKGDGTLVTVLSHRLDARMDGLADMARAARGGGGPAMMAEAPAPPAEGAAPKTAASKEVTGTAPSPAPSPPPGIGITAAGKPEAVRGAADTAATAKVTKGQKLKTMLAAYAVKHSAKLRTALERLPEPARQDILRSIAVAAANYEKALRSLD